MKPDFDYNSLKTPYYAVDERLLEKNLKILKDVADRSGCHILLAQKAFSMFHFYPLIAKYLDGATSSGLYESKLAKEHMLCPGKKLENHVFEAAYRNDEFEELLSTADHIIFNSFTQWEHFKPQCLASQAALKKAGICQSFGIRINPEHSTQEHGIYDPCAAGSRLGVTLKNFDETKLSGIEGLHMHTLCEQNSDALIETFEVFEQKFGKYLHRMKWLNLGGGHHITREDYDCDALIALIRRIKETYDIEVYLEPGEAVALNAGYLVTSVLDITENSGFNAILDASAACHMPDVIEMPYRPPLHNSGLPEEKAYTYRLGGMTCLSGDFIGTYSFDKPLNVGDRLIFEDMAIYSMVKNNTFNGMALPSIAAIDTEGNLKVVKEFGYKDFKTRLS